MKPIILRAGFVAAALLVAAAGTARAETLDVKVPFPFVVHGETLPAGDYRVETDGRIVLMRGEHGNKSGVVFATAPANGRDPAGDVPVLTFRKGETRYHLADIWESASNGATVLK
jgi:hypothetical protein